MSPSLTYERTLSSCDQQHRSPAQLDTPIAYNNFARETQSYLQLFQKHVRCVATRILFPPTINAVSSGAVAITDKHVLDALEQARSNYQLLVQQCARNPDQYERCLHDTLKICERLKAQLLQGEHNLAQRLNKPLESYYADLVCACRCVGTALQPTLANYHGFVRPHICARLQRAMHGLLPQQPRPKFGCQSAILHAPRAA